MIKAFLFDLDGVFYVEDQLLPGANDTLKWLQEMQIPYRFITNNTTLPRKQLTEKLNHLGLMVREDQLISANYAGVLYLKKQGFKSCRLALKEAAIADYGDFDTTTDAPEAIVVGDIGEIRDYPCSMDDEPALEGAQLVALRAISNRKRRHFDSGAFVAALNTLPKPKPRSWASPKQPSLN